MNLAYIHPDKPPLTQLGVASIPLWRIMSAVLLVLVVLEVGHGSAARADLSGECNPDGWGHLHCFPASITAQGVNTSGRALVRVGITWLGELPDSAYLARDTDPANLTDPDNHTQPANAPHIREWQPPDLFDGLVADDNVTPGQTYYYQVCEAFQMRSDEDLETAIGTDWECSNIARAQVPPQSSGGTGGTGGSHGGTGGGGTGGNTGGDGSGNYRGCVAPPAPTNAQATPVTPYHVKLSFTLPGGASSYADINRIEHGDAGDVAQDLGTTVVPVTPAAFDDTVKPGTTYTYELRGVTFGTDGNGVTTTCQSDAVTRVDITTPSKSTLGETSRYSPALAFYGGQYYLAWTGTNGALNIMASFDGRTWGSKVTLSERSAGAPALAAAGKFLYLAWTGTDGGPGVAGHLNVLSSLDGTHWSGKVTLAATATAGPALAGGSRTVAMTAGGDHCPPDIHIACGLHLPVAPDQLFLAWTDVNSHINVLASAGGGGDVPATFDEGNVQTLAETTQQTPAIALGANDADLHLAWTGTDSSHYVNVISIGLDGSTANKNTLGETTIGAPAIATPLRIAPSTDGPGAGDGRVIVAWTGTDGAGSLNLRPSTDHGATFAGKTTLGETSPVGPALLTFQAGDHDEQWLAWVGTNGAGNLNVEAR